MWKRPALTVLLTAVLSANVPAQDARAVVEEASRAMGVVDLDAITYSGAAAQGNFGQSRGISFGLASTQIRNYTRTIDFTVPASRATGDALTPAAAGVPPPEPGNYDLIASPATPAWAQQLEIWVTPWGFLRGAAAANPTVRVRELDGVKYKVVTWSPAQKSPSGQPYRLVGYINDDNLIERVETWVEHPVFGDMHVELFYRDYLELNGVHIPGRIAERRVGMETFVAAIKDAEANPEEVAELLALPAQAAAAPAPPPVASEKLAEGVYRITGGYVSLAVEFKDHVVVLEGGQSEARGRAIIAETRRLFPGKRIRSVVNTHPHFDHASGLSPFVADGVTVITQDNNKYFLEQALGMPRTLAGDTLAKSKRKPKVESVLDELMLQDGTRTLALYRVLKLEHSDGMLVAYLPKERILFTADFPVPAAGQPVSPSMVTLVDNIERLGLDFDRHIPVHTPGPDLPMNRAALVALVKGAR
jgi:glyoxylase-like metal-dependent hydrolase (beta-lactamase superfamily II)